MKIITEQERAALQQKLNDHTTPEIVNPKPEFFITADGPCRFGFKDGWAREHFIPKNGAPVPVIEFPVVLIFVVNDAGAEFFLSLIAKN